MKKIYLIVILIFTMTGPANAETNFYVGGGVGASLFSGSKDIDLFYENKKLVIKEEFSGNHITGKIFGGFRASEYSAVEFSLHRFGKPGALMTKESTDLINLAMSENFKPEDVTNSYKAQGMSLSLLGIIPASDEFEVFGKVGLLYSKIFSTAPANAQKVNQKGVKDNGGFDETGFAVLLGAGATYKITENLSLRAEFEWFPDIADEHEDRAKAVLKVINDELKKADIKGRVAYDVDLDVKSATASVVWNF